MYGFLNNFWHRGDVTRLDWYIGTGGHDDTLAPGSCRNLGTGVMSIPWHRGDVRGLATGLLLGTPVPGTWALASTLCNHFCRNLSQNAILPHLSISYSFIDMSLISRLNIRRTFGDIPVPGDVSGSGGGRLPGMVWYGMVWYGNRIISITKIPKTHRLKYSQKTMQKTYKNQTMQGFSNILLWKPNITIKK